MKPMVNKASTYDVISKYWTVNMFSSWHPKGTGGKFVNWTQRKITEEENNIAFCLK